MGIAPGYFRYLHFHPHLQSGNPWPNVETGSPCKYGGMKGERKRRDDEVGIGIVVYIESGVYSIHLGSTIDAGYLLATLYSSQRK